MIRLFRYTLLCLFVLFLFVMLIKMSVVRNPYVAENNIKEVSTERLMQMAADLNSPEWKDILLEAGEWALVAGATYYSIGLLSALATSAKTARTIKKATDISVATKASYTLLAKMMKRFYIARARPFNKLAITREKPVSGIYLFFDNLGEVKYVGKAQNLRQRLAQHLIGATNAGNSKLSENAAQLSFITLRTRAVGNIEAVNKCLEAIGINAFNNGNLLNKRIEKINKENCRQLLRK